jgi:NAD(P)-dependent dehydrogenase (short-subunit alcohol dehydrogenase family)
MDYSDRQVIVTGGTGAFGSAVVGALVEAGATCYVSWRHENEAQRDCRGQLRSTAAFGLPSRGPHYREGKEARAWLMFLGGSALEGPRYIWWNFVSSRRESIEQAKEDWKSGRFAPVPDETEFIPLPES